MPLTVSLNVQSAVYREERYWVSLSPEPQIPCVHANTAKHSSQCPDTRRTEYIPSQASPWILQHDTHNFTIAIIIHLFILAKAPPQRFLFCLNFHYQCSPICLIYTIHPAACRKIHDEIVNCKFRPGGTGLQSQLLRIKMSNPAWATEQSSEASTSELIKP